MRLLNLPSPPFQCPKHSGQELAGAHAWDMVSVPATARSRQRLGPGDGFIRQDLRRCCRSTLVLTPLSWSELEAKAAPPPERINGPTSAQADLRLFGASEGDVRVTLYRDHHAWCPPGCCRPSSSMAG